MIGQHFLKLGKSVTVFEHREFTVRIAWIVTRAELNGVDIEQFELLDNRGKRQMRQQWRKNSKAHDELSLSSHRR